MAEYDDNTEGEETIYDEEGREELIDDGEISPEEAGFMKGYEDADEESEEDDEEDTEE